MGMFPILSFQQNNPVLSGQQMAGDITSQALKNYAQQINNQFLQPTLEQQLQQSKYQTQIMAPQAQYAPQMTLADLLQKQALPAHTQAETQKMLQGEIPLEQAQAKYYGMRANPMDNPDVMPELTKADMRYSYLRQQFGEDDPRTAQAKNDYDLLSKQALSNSMWHQQLADTMGFRSLPTSAKEVLNTQQAQQGNQPSGLYNVPIGQIGSNLVSNPIGQPGQANVPQLPTLNPRQTTTLDQIFQGQLPGQMPNASQQNRMTMAQNYNYPQQQTLNDAITTVQAQQVGGQTKMSPQEVANNMQNALLKSTNTASNLNKIQFGSQVEQSLSNMMPFEPAMEYYTGPKGRAQLISDKAKVMAGFPATPEYNAYIAYQNHAEQAAKQMRQYWGDSIQPKNLESLSILTDPSAWDKDPSSVRAALNSTISNFNSELEQRRKAAQGPSIYQSGQTGTPLVGQQQLPSPAQSGAAISSGNIPNITSNNLKNLSTEQLIALRKQLGK